MERGASPVQRGLPERRYDQQSDTQHQTYATYHSISPPKFTNWYLGCIGGLLQDGYKRVNF